MAVPETTTVFMIQRRTSDSGEERLQAGESWVLRPEGWRKARISASVFNAKRASHLNGIKKAIAIGANQVGRIEGQPTHPTAGLPAVRRKRPAWAAGRPGPASPVWRAPCSLAVGQLMDPRPGWPCPVLPSPPPWRRCSLARRTPSTSRLQPLKAPGGGLRRFEACRRKRETGQGL